MKILLDTNVIIDNLAQRDGGESLEILTLCEGGVLEGIITTVTLMDVMYIMRKSISAAELREAAKMLMQIVDVVPALKSDINTALVGKVSDFEDAVQAACAVRIKAEFIVTRNKKHFIGSPVPAISPSELLKILRKAHI